MRTSTIKIGQHRNNSRLWLQGKWLCDHGFTPGSHIDVSYDKGKIVITPGEQRKVSGKKDGSSVIDLNCSDIRQSLKKAQQVTVTCEDQKIVITPARTARKRAARIAMIGAMTALSYFAGGGLLDTAAASAGYHVKAAMEVNEKYADIHQANHPDTHMCVLSVEEVEHQQLAQHGPFDLFIAGLPCEPYSAIRRTDSTGKCKVKKDHPEAHHLGDMTFWTLHAIDIHNPHTVVLEEVPKYLNSASFCVLKHALERMGYLVDARIVNPRDYGSITGRKRVCIVATTFDEVRWPKPIPQQQVLGDLLDDVPLNSDVWFDRDHWAPKHWRKQTDKGNGFAPPVLNSDSVSVPTIKKGYMKRQGDSPVVAHPKKAETYRWLTLGEIRRIMGLPDTYDLGKAQTTAGEVMGQGVEVCTFSHIIASVMQAASQMKNAA